MEQVINYGDYHQFQYFPLKGFLYFLYYLKKIQKKDVLCLVLDMTSHFAEWESAEQFFFVAVDD